MLMIYRSGKKSEHQLLKGDMSHLGGCNNWKNMLFKSSDMAHACNPSSWEL